MKNRILSFLLMFAMFISFVPNVYAGNNNSLPSNPSYSTEGSWKGVWDYTENYSGIRLSVYWAKSMDAFTNGGAVIQVGETIDITKTGPRYKVEAYTGLSIYDYMHDGVEYSRLFNQINPYQYIDTSDATIVKEMPNVINGTKVQWDEWFESPQNGEPTYKNIPAITSLTGVSISSEDFAKGIFNYQGAKMTGQYKIFFEPILYPNIDGVAMVVTLRDSIKWVEAFDAGKIRTKDNKSITGWLPQILVILANSQFLIENEKAINMTANSPVYQAKYNKSNADRQELTTQISKGGQIYNSMGVGVITPATDPTTYGKVVTSYVKLLGVNTDGTPKYEQIKVEASDAELDEKGAVKVEDVKGLEEGTAYLNDVFTSPKNLSAEVSSLNWTGDLPATPKESIEATAEDIWSYNLSIRTGILNHIDDLVEAKDTAEYSQIVELKQEYTDTFKKYALASTIAEKNTYAFKLNKLFSQIIELAGIDSDLNKQNSQLLKLVKVTNLTALKEESDNIVKKSLYIEDLNNVYLFPISERPIAEESTFSYTVTPKQANPTGTQNSSNNTTTTITGTGASGEQLTTLYLRYVVIPERQVRHIINIYKNGEYASTEIKTEKLPVQEEGDGYATTVEIPQIKDAEFISWSTSKELPMSEKMPVNPIKSGKTLDPIADMDADENLYIEWKKEINTSTVVPDSRLLVEQWRLSKFTPNLGWNSQAYMNLNLKSDAGHATSTLSPSGAYSYKTINPNGQYTSEVYNPLNYNYSDYIQSKALTQGSYSLSHTNHSATVDVTGTLNLIKGTKTFGLKTASWLTSSAAKAGLTLHNISTDDKPSSYTGAATTNKSDVLKYGIENIQTYNHNYGVYYHYTCHHKKYSHDVCACYTLPETFTPKSSKVTYLTSDYKIDSTFDRYITKGSDKLIVAPNVTVENGKTTVSYQSNTELNIYPEIAMLFDNSQGESSIKWVVGEQSRKISPVIYHTLQFKVWVDERSNATAFATDTRATATASRMGESGKQVAYKGTSINTSYGVQRASDNTNKGILTVKTYALDLSANKNGVDVKNVWGASSYNVKNIHTNFLNQWTFNGTATEKLEIASSPLYNGAISSKAINLGKLSYSGETSVEFTHELIIRGGVVVGVRVQDKNTKAYSVVTIDKLKEKDEALYEALVSMKLIGSKDTTVLKGFEHQTGAQLTEEKYLSLANAAKSKLDGFATQNLTLNKGWYSEDSTVLVVKEYVTNYEVPSVAFTDKISLSVAGLETPVDKNMFFSKMATGHTYLKYNFSSTDLSSLNSTLGTANVYFETSSRLGSEFGAKKTDYLVPNVSVIDITSKG